MQIAKYLIDSPLLNLFIMALAGCIYFGGVLLKLHHTLGEPRHLRKLTLLWAVNTFWEWSRLLKSLYAPRWDIYIVYPTIFLISTILLSLWVFSILRSLDSKEGSQEKQIAKKAIFSGYTFLLLLAPKNLESTARTNPIVLIIPPLGAAIITALFSLITHGTLTEFFRHFGIGALFGALLLGAAFVLTRLRGFEDRKGDLRAELQRKADIIESGVNELGSKVREFEIIALDKFHLLSADVNHEFSASKRVHERLSARLDTVKKLIAEGGEAELIAADKLLKTEIDVRDNFVDGIITGGQTTHLMPEEWGDALKKRSHSMDVILTSFKNQVSAE